MDGQTNQQTSPPVALPLAGQIVSTGQVLLQTNIFSYPRVWKEQPSGYVFDLCELKHQCKTRTPPTNSAL